MVNFASYIKDRKSSCIWAAAAFSIYTLAAVLLFSQALLSGGEFVLGDDKSDVWKHLWGAWWMGQELKSGHLPLWTDLQNYPSGGVLYIIDPLNAFVTGLLSSWLGLPQAYNVTCALQVVAAAMCLRALALWITRSQYASLVAGFIYGFCPFILTSGISSGIAETANLAWLPLAILGLLQGFAGESYKKAVTTASLGLALTALGCWYYGMTAVILVLLLFSWVVIFKRLPFSHQGPINWGAPLLSCILALLLISPVAFAFAGSLKGNHSLLAKIEISQRQERSSMEFLHQKGQFKNNATLAGYVTPGKEQLSVSKDVDLREKTVYLGWVGIILGIFGLIFAKRATIFWALAGLITIILSTGPFLYLTHNIYLPKAWNLVYMLAYNIVPGFRMAAITDRLSIAVQLCLAIAACHGLKEIISRKGEKVNFLIVSGIVLLMALELVLVSPVPYPLPVSSSSIPQIYTTIANEPERLGVIELPLNRTETTMQPGEYFYHQTVHNKPIALSLTTRFPTILLENKLTGCLIMCEDPHYGTPPAPWAFTEPLAELKEYGFGWIVVNGNLMRPETFSKVKDTLNILLGQPKTYKESKLLYKIK